ncbi:MAG: type II toxin-antitoxin system RelE/ParE family toxin [Candidatus Nomurabacteria bacterium]
MLTVFSTEEFEKRLRLLPKIVQKKAIKQINIFKEYPFYPSLNNEKLEPKDNGLWSIRIDQKYRILYKYDKNNIVVLLTCGSHDWLYDVSRFYK